MLHDLIAIFSVILAFAGLIAYVLVLASFRKLPHLWKHSFFKLAAHLAIGDMTILIIALVHWIPSLYQKQNVPLYDEVSNAILSTIALLATWLIFLNVAAIAINRLIGVFLHPLKARFVIKSKTLTFSLLALIWVPLIVGMAYFGFFHCFVVYTNVPFHFRRKCLKNDSITVYFYFYGYILCLLCMITTMACYGIVTFVLKFDKKQIFNSIQMREKRREARLFFQGALIASSLLLEYVCSYVANFYFVMPINRFFLIALIINSSVNPLILLLFNEKVKHQVRILFNFSRPRRAFEHSLDRRAFEHSLDHRAFEHSMDHAAFEYPLDRRRSEKSRRFETNGKLFESQFETFQESNLKEPKDCPHSLVNFYPWFNLPNDTI